MTRVLAFLVRLGFRSDVVDAVRFPTGLVVLEQPSAHVSLTVTPQEPAMSAAVVPWWGWQRGPSEPQ